MTNPAQTSSQPAKVIKIGLIQDGKLLSENVFRDKAEITIGSDPSNTISIKEPSLPRQHKLITQAKNGYDLNYLPEMDGRVSLKSGLHDMRKLKESGLGQSRGKYSSVNIGDLGKGKISIGKTTILFQVLSSVEAEPLKKMPKEYRGPLFSRLDATFAIIILISGLFHIATVKYLNSMPIEDILSEANADKIVTISQPDDIPMPTEEEKLANDEAGKEKEGSGGGDAKKPKSGGGGEGPKEVNVSAMGVLGILTVNKAGSGVDDLISNSGLGKGVEDALKGVSGGVGVAAGGTGAGLLAGGKGGTGGGLSTIGAGSLGSSSGPRGVDTGNKAEHAVKAKIDHAEGGISGNMNADSARSYIIQRIGGIRNCYESQLKIDPNLSGKVAVTFGIGGAGEVTNCSVTTSTISDPSVSQCVCQKIGHWKFPLPPEGGSATISYSFIFTPAS
jgi:hypothetical protein